MASESRDDPEFLFRISLWEKYEASPQFSALDLRRDPSPSTRGA
jgi:hypothetical protein